MANKRQPDGQPKFNGEIRKTRNKWVGEDEYWKFNGNTWERAWEDTWYGKFDKSELKDIIDEYEQQQKDLLKVDAGDLILSDLEGRQNNRDELRKDAIKVKASAIPPAGVTATSSGALRYPSAAPIDNAHDYVTFQFYKYAPPFRKRERTRTVIKADGKTDNKKDISANLYDYNQASKEENQYTKRTQAPPIVLYMPEDISTGFRSNWTGKAFGNFAAGALMAAGAEGGMDKLEGTANTISNSLKKFVPIAGAKALAKVVKKIGGDTVDINDITGGMSGAILNPNVELMYGGGDLRNFSLNFKLVPRDSEEKGMINQICNQFKKAMLPKMDPGNVLGTNNDGTFAGFIGVPDLCRVAFMHGGNEHEALPRFKMCAITQVDVNYTPDGTYATYYDGQPVAVQLTISFQETKLVFSEEIGGIR
jgi:hypothetical protein